MGVKCALIMLSRDCALVFICSENKKDFIMRFLLSALVILSLSACIGAGRITEVGHTKSSYFPSLVGIDLLGKERVLPDDFKGTLNVVAVAFEREQQADVDTWIAAIDNITDNYKEVRFYEVPLIYEVSGIGRFWINNGMRSGIPSDAARERTITVYTDRDVFFKTMDMSVDQISVVLLDDEGKILWRADGPANESIVQSLKTEITDFSS